MKDLFHDQVVIVTGASAGIGKSLALMLTSQCAKVVIAARRADRLEQIAEVCHAFCGEVLVIPNRRERRSPLQGIDR
jgi:NADP-dependent 3-hydroxy acid dehydrogenase YdfG